MNTKEAIEFFKDIYEGYISEYVIAEEEEGYFNKKNEVTALLKRGEKYEKIFNTILNWTIHDGSFIPVKELINLEQKYFPETKIKQK